VIAAALWHAVEPIGERETGFWLSGIATLLDVFSTRLARLTDRIEGQPRVQGFFDRARSRPRTGPALK
jgi:hypothetical protein